jgi:hypothetical protein
MKKRLKAVPGTVPTEEEDQIRFATWLALQGIKFTASANGGSRHYLEAAKLKRMGVSPGFPDIEIPLPSGGYHGLYIEMKREKAGILSSYQRNWLEYLREKHYYAEVAHGFDEAKEIVLHYLSLTPKAA